MDPYVLSTYYARKFESQDSGNQKCLNFNPDCNFLAVTLDNFYNI